MNKKRIAVFCGSRTGKNPLYAEHAAALADAMIRKDIGLVYGGGNIGLMGIIANKIMEQGGEVIGVIPQKLKDMEVAHEQITELHVVHTMHERKALMAEKSDGFIAMPGGIGTLEEIVEVFTWLQLGYHSKPCGFLNTNGFFDRLFDFLDHTVTEGFLSQEQRDCLMIEKDPNALIQRML